jgi:hypothetical protein
MYNVFCTLCRLLCTNGAIHVVVGWKMVKVVAYAYMYFTYIDIKSTLIMKF